jgi:hypothetical protein
MAITRTYTVGDGGGVRRQDNLTGAWLDVSVTNTYAQAIKIKLFDVETDPFDGDKVFAIGEGIVVHGLFGIYVSTNAGATWQVPGGNYQTNIDPGLGKLKWYEVWVLDSNTIFVCGNNGYVAKSTDGGLTFNLCTQLPSLPTCPACAPTVIPVYSIHFVTPLIGIVGTPQNVVGTIDGGITWIVLNGGSVLTPISGNIFDIVGIHMSADFQTIVACGTGRMMQSLDAGSTFNEVYDWQRMGLHLTWINDLELWGFGRNDRIIKSVDGGATWITLFPDVGGGPYHRAGHFYQGPNGYFSTDSDILTTNNGATSGTFSETSPHGVEAVWTFFNVPVCYRLVDCKGVLAPIITVSDLSGIVGQVVQICYNPCFPSDCPCDTPVDACWLVEISPTCQGALADGEIFIMATYPDCITCLPHCYLLRDCEGLKPDIITGNNLSQYVGQVIQLEGCGNTCWQVIISQTCDNCIPLSAITNSFQDCATCLPPPPSPPPLELNPRRIKPGYTTPGCPPEYTEKVNCAFMDAMYDNLLARRYGIDSCCEADEQKWTLKKELLDLKALYDPSLCKSSLVDCCPPCRIVAEIEVFAPIQCAPPTNVTVQLGGPVACDAPTGLQPPSILIQ